MIIAEAICKEPLQENGRVLHFVRQLSSSSAKYKGNIYEREEDFSCSLGDGRKERLRFDINSAAAIDFYLIKGLTLEQCEALAETRE